MIMYTEKQLEESYAVFIHRVIEIRNIQKVLLDIPSLEEFRLIYESGWEEILDDEWYLDDNNTRH